MRLRPRTLILAIVLLIAFVIGQWFFFKSRFEAALPTFEARAAALGFDIQYGSRSIGGFPFRLEARYKDVSLLRSNALLSLAVEADSAVLVRQLMRQDLTILSIEKPRFAVSAAAPLPNGKSGEANLAFEAPAMQTSLRSEDEALARISTVVDLPTGRGTVFGLGAFSAKQLQFHMNWPLEGRRAPEGQPAPRILIDSQFADLLLEDRDTGPLPPKIAKGHIGLQINLPSYAPLTSQGLRLWQLDGGSVDILRLDGAWGDIVFGSTSGSLKLDDTLRPQGDITVTVRGLAALTYALDKTGVLPPEAEEFALITLRLMRAGKKAEDDVPLPIQISDGVVRLGPAPLVQLGPVVPFGLAER